MKLLSEYIDAKFQIHQSVSTTYPINLSKQGNTLMGIIETLLELLMNKCTNLECLDT